MFLMLLLHWAYLSCLLMEEKVSLWPTAVGYVELVGSHDRFGRCCRNLDFRRSVAHRSCFPGVFVGCELWLVMVYPTVGDGPNQSHPKINQRMVWVDVEFYSLFLGRFFANITNGCYGRLDVKCDTLNSLNHIDHIDIDYHWPLSISAFIAWYPFFFFLSSILTRKIETLPSPDFFRNFWGRPLEPQKCPTLVDCDSNQLRINGFSYMLRLHRWF